MVLIIVVGTIVIGSISIISPVTLPLLCLLPSYSPQLG